MAPCSRVMAFICRLVGLLLVRHGIVVLVIILNVLVQKSVDELAVLLPPDGLLVVDVVLVPLPVHVLRDEPAARSYR